MVTTDFEQKIYDFIKGREHVSCVELSKEFGQGDQVISKEEDENLVTAFGMSEELAQAVVNLTSRADIVPLPASILSYAVDGGMLNMPIAKKLPKGGYKTQHWLPVTYCTLETAIREMERTVKDKDALKTILANLEAKRSQA
jgi:hypothetical protein